MDLWRRGPGAAARRRAARRRRRVPVLHGPFGEDGTLQGLLELLDVPYVGAGVLASSLCMDKVVFKEVLAAAGVPQVPYAGVREPRWQAEPEAVLRELAVLGKPVFVKPARLGSSVGIAKVWSEAELGPALDTAFAHDSLVIVEGFSAGMEVECSVIGLDDARGLGSRRDRPHRLGLVRLRGQVHRRRDGARGPRPARRRGARGGPPARPRHVRARRLHRPGAGRLLRRGRRARDRQRAQHDARLHQDERVPEAVGGVRAAVPGPLRQVARARARSASSANAPSLFKAGIPSAPPRSSDLT